MSFRLLLLIAAAVTYFAPIKVMARSIKTSFVELAIEEEPEMPAEDEDEADPPNESVVESDHQPEKIGLEPITDEDH